MIDARKRLLPDVCICLALIAGTLGLYEQVRRFSFVNFDDPDFATAPPLRNGFTADAVSWAITSGDSANWLPVTRLSHLLDYQLYGPQSGPAHVTSVAIHALACVLLFLFLRRATGSRTRSALVASVFAWHPMHVESVAWVAERKDVLCAFFWFLTMLLWVRYVEKPGRARYAAALLSFCLGLMAKPMIVTLPCVLLLIDAWPLRRPLSRRLMLEKLPFVLLSAAGSVVTYLVQGSAGAVAKLETFPAGLRLENIAVSYAAYLGKTLWPTHLAFWYPYPNSIPWWQAASCAAGLVAATIIAVRRFAPQPWLTVGWLWFVGSLVPVIGLVQVGSQARADRYMYLPMAGLLIAVVWEAADRTGRLASLQKWAMAAAVCISLWPVTWRQIGTWKDDRTLFTHAVNVTDGNYVAYNNLGSLDEKIPGRDVQAYAEFDRARLIKPNFSPAWYNCGNLLMRAGRLDEAQHDFEEALRLNPGYGDAENNLGAVLGLQGRWKEAVSHLELATRLSPGTRDAWRNLGNALLKSGDTRFGKAVESLEMAVQFDPRDATAQSMLGFALARVPGRLPDAVEHLREAVRIDPGLTVAHSNLGRLLAQMPGGRDEAATELNKVLERDPGDSETRHLLQNLH